MFKFFATMLLVFLSTVARSDEVGQVHEARSDIIHVYNWVDYIDPQTLRDFERDTGIHVEYHTFRDVAELQGILHSDAKVDVAVPIHDALPSMISEGLLQPLDLASLSNRKHLDSVFLAKLSAFDPKNLYAAPYQWGAVGIAINRPKAEAAYGESVPSSWSILFDPEKIKRFASCGVGVMNAPDIIISALLNYRGFNPSNINPARIKKVGRDLFVLRESVKYIDNDDSLEALRKGESCMSVVWNGGALGAMNSGQPIYFFIPREGSELYIDAFVVPKSASRPDLAHKFINYMMKPKVAAKNSMATLSPSVNADSLEFVDPAVRDQPAFRLDRETRARLFLQDSLPVSHSDLRQEIWRKFMQGM